MAIHIYIYAGGLKFSLDGKDETQGTIAATQARINQLFSAELPDTLFHSQQSVLKLLEATDTEFKSTMATLVDLSVWQSCEEESKAEEKAALALLHDSTGSLRALEKAQTSAKASASAAQVRTGHSALSPCSRVPCPLPAGHHPKPVQALVAEAEVAQAAALTGTGELEANACAALDALRSSVANAQQVLALRPMAEGGPAAPAPGVQPSPARLPVSCIAHAPPQ